MYWMTPENSGQQLLFVFERLDKNLAVWTWFRNSVYIWPSVTLLVVAAAAAATLPLLLWN